MKKIAHFVSACLSLSPKPYTHHSISQSSDNKQHTMFQGREMCPTSAAFTVKNNVAWFHKVIPGVKLSKPLIISLPLAHLLPHLGIHLNSHSFRGRSFVFLKNIILLYMFPGHSSLPITPQHKGRLLNLCVKAGKELSQSCYRQTAQMHSGLFTLIDAPLSSKKYK